jgi:hypothetical protein
MSWNANDDADEERKGAVAIRTDARAVLMPPKNNLRRICYMDTIDSDCYFANVKAHEEKAWQIHCLGRLLPSLL